MNLENTYKNAFILFTTLLIVSFLITSTSAEAPPPASAHRNSFGVSMQEDKEMSPSSAEKQQPKARINKVPMSKISQPKRTESINPYELEKNYSIRKNPSTVPQNNYKPSPEPRVKKVKKIITPAPAKKAPTKPSTPLEVEETATWQSSDYEFTKDRNIIYYPKDSKLKMISLQIFVENSTGGRTTTRMRQLLTKIHNALPVSPLIVGLQQLYDKKALYPLNQWNQEKLNSAIKKVSSRTPDSTIGENLRVLRQNLTNIPTPTRFLLITDGESYDASSVAFDLKLFYAPDPRFPLNVISFATTDSTKESIDQIIKVHDGSLLFNGNELLKDEALFNDFMKQLFIK